MSPGRNGKHRLESSTSGPTWWRTRVVALVVGAVGVLAVVVVLVAR